jgi:hypothetical protein
MQLNPVVSNEYMMLRSSKGQRSQPLLSFFDSFVGALRSPRKTPSFHVSLPAKILDAAEIVSTFLYRSMAFQVETYYISIGVNWSKGNNQLLPASTLSNLFTSLAPVYLRM